MSTSQTGGTRARPTIDRQPFDWQSWWQDWTDRMEKDLDRGREILAATPLPQVI